jgi:biotin carboxyl carrier protein
MIIRLKSCFNLCVLSGIISLTSSCRHSTETSEETTEVKTPVTITHLTFKSVASTVELPAVSAFMNKSIIRASITGSIEKILISTGDFINSGQKLFTIKTREASAIGKIPVSDTNLSFNGLINIMSNEEGVINSVSYQKGDFVQEGDELAVVSQQSSLVFILDVPFELDKYVAKNIKCAIILPDSIKITGTITGKLAEMDMQSQTIRYLIKPVSAGRLPANLIGTVSLVRSSSSDAVVLPKRAVLGNETQTEFWVMKLIDDSTAIKINVIKGFESNSEVEITDPVFTSEDRIILTGNYGLPDTARISIIEE